MESMASNDSTLKTPRRPAVWIGLAINIPIIIALLSGPFLFQGQGDPSAAWRFWMYLYILIFPILIPAIFSLLYLDFFEIKWCNNRFHCVRTIFHLQRLIGKSVRLGERFTVHYDPAQVSLVWEGVRLLLYCDGLPSGIYLGRGLPAEQRLQWFLDKGVSPPFQV